MNKFYTIPIFFQWPLVILLGFIGGMPLGLTFQFAILKTPIFLFLLPFVYPLAVFSITPFLKLIGYLHYYSPMLLATIDKNKIELHHGTSFDYLFVMKFSDFGFKAKKKLLIYYLEGLLNLIEEIESGTVSKGINIEGASYFFSKNTASKLGFKLMKPKIHQRLWIIINFLDLFWMYSYSKGTISIPNIFNVNRALTNGENLCNQKNKIGMLIKRIKNDTSPNML